MINIIPDIPIRDTTIKKVVIKDIFIYYEFKLQIFVIIKKVPAKYIKIELYV